MEIASFTPLGESAVINPTTSPQNLTLNKAYGSQSGGKQRVFNGTNVTVFMSAYGAATLSSLPLAAGAVILLECGANLDSISLIVASTATGNVYATPGRGGI